MPHEGHLQRRERVVFEVQDRVARVAMCVHDAAAQGRRVSTVAEHDVDGIRRGVGRHRPFDLGRNTAGGDIEDNPVGALAGGEPHLSALEEGIAVGGALVEGPPANRSQEHGMVTAKPGKTSHRGCARLARTRNEHEVLARGAVRRPGDAHRHGRRFTADDVADEGGGRLDTWPHPGHHRPGSWHAHAPVIGKDQLAAHPCCRAMYDDRVLNTPPAALSLRHMTPQDLPEVARVERAAYSTGWPATAFERELTQNRLARYVVLEAAGAVLGFAGLWLMVDQAHVVTVAVDPAERRRGYGRLLVHALVDMAMREGMESATLEVRASNDAARSLYRAYGFYDVGLRKKYYSDNGEDAVIMTTEALAGTAYGARFEQLEGELARRLPGATPRVPLLVD